MKLEIVCSSCGNNFLKDVNEIKRQKKNKGENTPFYCSLRCFGKSKIAIPEIINKTCKCGSDFKTSTGATYCSKSCASFYSASKIEKSVEFINKLIDSGKNTRFTNKNLEPVADTLRIREWSKYDLLHSYLLSLSINHSFEFALPNTKWIFDLVIHDLNLLIEFDEIYHDYNSVKDKEKELDAVKLGWFVVRIDVRNSSIPYRPKLIEYLLVSYE